MHYTDRKKNTIAEKSGQECVIEFFIFQKNKVSIHFCEKQEENEAISDGPKVEENMSSETCKLLRLKGKHEYNMRVGMAVNGKFVHFLVSDFRQSSIDMRETFKSSSEEKFGIVRCYEICISDCMFRDKIEAELTCLPGVEVDSAG